MMEMFDIILTHQALAILLFPDSSLDIIKTSQRTILKIDTACIRILNLHKCKPVYLNRDIRGWQIPADFLNNIQMSLDQMVNSWRQPI